MEHEVISHTAKELKALMLDCIDRQLETADVDRELFILGGFSDEELDVIHTFISSFHIGEEE
jgi:hypothetical protein